MRPFAPRWPLSIVVVALVAAGCATTLDINVSREGSAASTPGATPEGSGPVEVTDPDPDLTGRATWVETTCRFTEPADVETTCGWLTVPERWDLDNDDDTISLHVGIFSNGGAGAPVVYLEGGPGGDALANIDTSFSSLWASIVDEHDVVIIGQRGTGSAEPSLDCSEVNELELDLLDDVVSVTDEADAYELAYRSCVDRLRDAGADLAAYNSVQNATDVEALRLALGHDQWNVIGISYGTRLGQTLMRLYPDGIRSIILDSVLPTRREAGVDIPKVAERAYTVLFEECAASPACAAAYPDLEPRFFALVDRLDEQPASFQVADSITGEQYAARMDGDDLLGVGFQALYSKEAFSGLPELVAQLEQGDTSGAETLVGLQVTSLPFVAGGMYWAVQCHEEVPFVQPGDADAGRTGDPYYDRMGPPELDDTADRLCEAFEAGTADPAEDELVVSDLPALLMAGRYDPITPPSDTRSLLDGLSAAHYVELPHTGHAALADPCGQEIALAFMADPDRAPSTDCLADIAEPPWVIDIFEDVEFEPFSYDEFLVSGRGVAPVGWEAGSEGSFVQADNLLHLSVLLQQAVDGVPPDFLVASLADILGGDPVELPAHRCRRQVLGSLGGDGARGADRHVHRRRRRHHPPRSLPARAIRSRSCARGPCRPDPVRVRPPIATLGALSVTMGAAFGGSLEAGVSIPHRDAA